jgi:hypothetical protein
VRDDLKDQVGADVNVLTEPVVFGEARTGSRNDDVRPVAFWLRVRDGSQRRGGYQVEGGEVAKALARQRDDIRFRDRGKAVA